MLREIEPAPAQYGYRLLRPTTHPKRETPPDRPSPTARPSD
jgi:hypothetical protein